MPRVPLNDKPKTTDRFGPWGRRALIIWSVIGAFLVLYGVSAALRVLSIPVGIVIWTTIFVFCLNWQINALERRGLSRLAATGIAYVGLIVFFAVLGGLLFSPLFGVGDQFHNLLAGIPEYLDQVSVWINEMYARYGHLTDSSTMNTLLQSLQSSATEWLKGAASTGVGNLIDIGSVTANSLLCIGFALVVAFWLLLELPALEREIYRLMSGRYREDFHFFRVTMTRALGGYIKATILQCAIIAIGCIIAFSILGMPNSVALGVITGILNIIPVVGAWLGGAVAGFGTVFYDPLVALLALVVTVVIQQVVYTVISPKLMANSVDVHPAIVILAMMIGSALGAQQSGLMGSLVGMLLSIPIAAMVKATFVYYYEKSTGRSIVSPDGVLFKGVPSNAGASRSSAPGRPKQGASPQGRPQRGAGQRQGAQPQAGAAQRRGGKPQGEPGQGRSSSASGSRPQNSRPQGSAPRGGRPADARRADGRPQGANAHGNRNTRQAPAEDRRASETRAARVDAGTSAAGTPRPASSQVAAEHQGGSSSSE